MSARIARAVASFLWGPKFIALFLLFACVVLPGCTVCQNAKRTICGEPSEYWWLADRKRSVAVYREWADNAWCQHGFHDCGQSVSTAYEIGFKDGFVDYVFAGGAGEPPPVPPRQFWNVSNRNPNGHAEAEQWFAGFRHGAQVAHNEGYRERTVVPASVFFGPDQDCWGDQPCCEQPYLAPDLPPMPSTAIPELLPPGQVEPKSPGEEFSPLLPSMEPQVTEQPNSAERIEEEMLVPDFGTEQALEPQVPELSPPPAAAPDPSPNLEVPRPATEPEESIDDIFGNATSQRRTRESSALARTGRTKRRHSDVKVQQARAAFSSALLRSKRRGQSVASPRADGQLQHTTSAGKPQNPTPAVIPVGAVSSRAAVQRSHHNKESQRPRVSKSDKRAAEMFRRLSN